MPKGKGFTLIELLVVISIIALLSSVVLASLNSARDRAKVAGISQFASSAYHAAGDGAVGIWEFDECSGSAALDRSGFGNDGALAGGAAYSSSDTPTGKGCSMDLSANGRYLNVGTGSSISGISGPVSVMGWMKITTSHCYNWIFSNDRDVSTGYNGFSLGAYCSNQPIFRIWNGTSVSATGPALQNDRWYHLAGTYDGATMKLYIDGRLVSTVSYSGGVGTPASFSGIIGNLGACANCTPHGMYVDSVYVFAKALLASDVERIYAQGLPERSLAAE